MKVIKNKLNNKTACLHPSNKDLIINTFPDVENNLVCSKLFFQQFLLAVFFLFSENVGVKGLKGKSNLLRTAPTNN